jgi:hypothetical protein
VIMWTVILVTTIGDFEGWMHGAFRYAVGSVAGLFLVGLPLYWWRGKRLLLSALTARAASGRWPRS